MTIVIKAELRSDNLTVSKFIQFLHLKFIKLAAMQSIFAQRQWQKQQIVIKDK